MEKLQAAIETARNRRGGTPVPPRRTDPGARKGRAGEADARWSALAELTPARQTLRAHRIVTAEPSGEAAPFDILRTKILLQMRQNGWRRIAITSPLPKSGKTTAACNLALGMHRQKELRTILFDLDLRDPSVHTFFGHRPARSVGEVLTGGVGFADQALRIGDNLAVAMSHSPNHDPTRILLSEHTGEVLERIERDYAPDIMLFDLPSLLVNDDTRAFLKNVDCALIISRANATRYSHFDACEREVAEHTNVLGVVLNACRHTGVAREFG